MTARAAFVAVCMTTAAACGELSSTPGADAGALPRRMSCDDCPGTFMTCLSGECRFACGGVERWECPEGTRCVGLACMTDVVPTCEDLPCNADQTCFSTYCVGPGPRPCRTGTPGDCARHEFCLGPDGRCTHAPPCDADGTCRSGHVGAVCNRGDPDERPAPELDPETCLFGRCLTNDHCPAPLACADVGDDTEAPRLGWCR